MSRETNEGVMMHFKTITMNLLTIVHLPVEPITPLVKPKDSMGLYISIMQNSWTVTSSKPVISPSLFRFFFFGNMLRYNRYSWGTVKSHVGNSADSCEWKNRSRKMKCMASRNYIFIINLIKARYVLCWGSYIKWKSIVEAILSKSFLELSDTDKFFILVSLNPIMKQFSTISNVNSHSNCCT